MNDVSRILNSLQAGDPRAASELIPIVYDELRVLARQRLAKEAPGQTLQATALVHEAYLRLLGDECSSDWNSQAHFFGAAAEAMRRILIERARAKLRLKRGGGRRREDIEPEQLPLDPIPEDILALDEALARFAEKEPVKARLVELRYFGGLGQSEAARVLDISRATADRYWAYARAWLYSELGDE